MAKTNEIALNSLLGQALKRKHPLWRKHLHTEQTQVFERSAYLQPDILITPPNAQPVVVETEYLPALTVEKDATGRLGLIPKDSTEPVEQAIAVRIPTELSTSQSSLRKKIAEAKFEYCIFSGTRDSFNRWPESGWLIGDLDDIARCIEHAMISERLVAESISILENAIEKAANVIQADKESGYTDVETNLGNTLCQAGGEQTNRMAMTIIANALAFHQTIAGVHKIPSITLIQSDPSKSLQAGLLQTWRQILDEINYWPIFKIASELLIQLRPVTSTRILDLLLESSNKLARLGVNTRHDLSGTMFQKLIADREFLATFYTLPSSAHLLAELAIAKLSFNWDEKESYENLRIADLACGTGTLLSAAYHALLSRYRHAGGDDKTIHTKMIEKALIAADIMPAASHLCASQLSSVHPTVTFRNTRIFTMPYGFGKGEEMYREAALGSLDLLSSDVRMSLFATGQRQASGSQDDVEVRDLRFRNNSADLVIMNPPFTRPTNHEVAEVPVPSFAGFGTSDEEQEIMSRRLSKIRKSLDRPAGHGNAGLASYFFDLAHLKVKEGGVIAFVLPSTAIQGASWEGLRTKLATDYSNIVFVTIATTGNSDRAFSADTGMAETLIVGTKQSNIDSNNNILYINLRRRPKNILEAVEIAKFVRHFPTDSIFGKISAGTQVLGNYVRSSLNDGGCAGVREEFLIKSALALTRGKLLLPRTSRQICISMTTLDKLASRGVMSRDIGSKKEVKPPYRGPFTISPIDGIPVYPVLWNHDATRERQFIVEPDRDGRIRPGCRERANELWKDASNLHFNVDFQINSQSLSACMTAKPTLGGRAWPNFHALDSRWAKPICLWMNTTLGLISFWWRGTRQQEGRAIISISRLPSLPILDIRTLSAREIADAEFIFDELCGETFLPANEAYRDDVRQSLDRAVLVDLLNYPEDLIESLSILRLMWCSEPSVHGGQETAPENWFAD